MDVGLNFGIDRIAVAWWIFLILIWIVQRRLVGYRGVTTFTIFLPLAFLTNGILVPLTRDLNYQITGVELNYYDYYWWGLALMYLCLLVGIVLANWLFRRPAPPPQLEQCDVVGNPSGCKWYVAIVLIISVVSLIQIYAGRLSFDLYSYVTMRMDYDTYAAHRYGFAEATKGWEYFIYNKLPYGIAPVSIILVWNARGLATWKRVAFISILGFALVQTGHKMPAVFMAAFMVVPSALIRRRLVLDRRTAWISVAVFLIALVAVVPMFYLMQGNETYGTALFWSVERVFLEEARALQLYFEVYPNVHPFLHGASTGAIAKLMGVNDYITPSIYIPTEVLGLTDTSFPTLFIGEGWADFGFYGVALTAIVVGFLLQIYNIWFYSRRQPRLEETALFLSLILGAYHLQESNLLTSFFSYGIVSNFIIYLLIRQSPTMAKRRASLNAKAESISNPPFLSSPGEA